MPKQSPDGRVWAIRKNDATKQKFRWPAHLVELDDNLDFAPSEKNRRRVTEPEPNTTPKASRVAEPKDA
ncbi:hypothetical protein [Citricoccus sp. K5]|uniref:hypothetical protein n=1 Tax=Citricoccus sp. K5 TaxID=2653135 RepID=UPI0012F1A47E|nr:hypothetical protein [Citricoccus sp. K5]VXA92385.1 hypothetical protein CITRIK5_100019 [Citricoccus sp. K5]VXA94557.1 hypothetical protein CITRIK5_100085 [Citricoccus sp. K5]